MYIEPLIHTLLYSDCHDAIARNRARLNKMAAVIPETTPDGTNTMSDTLKLILRYDFERGSCPTVEILRGYLVTLDNAVDKGLSEIVNIELDAIEEDVTHELSEVELLIDEVMKEVRSLYWELSFNNAIRITVSGVPTTKGLLLKGPDDAMRYLAQRRSTDLICESNLAAGFLHENADLLQANLETAIGTTTTGRLKLGFDCIDKNLLIGRGANMNRFIGILGCSGDGKSTITHSIVYNMMCQGATILYNSTEHDPEQLWEIMAFLCYERVMDKLALPTRFVWDMARGGVEEYKKQITPKHIENMRIITDGLKNRTLVSGTVDCRQFKSMPEIVDHMTANDAKYHYDALVVDYLDRMDVGDPRFEKEGKKKLISDCQGLTRSWMNGKGITILSPIQVNKAGKLAADKAEAGERRYQRDAVRENTEYVHDMDFIFSVYSTPEMRLESQIELDMVKPPRMGLEPLREIAALDRRTGKVATLTGAEFLRRLD